MRSARVNPNLRMAVQLTKPGLDAGVSGATVELTVEDVATANSWLDWNDGNFKTSGWTTREVVITEDGNEEGLYGRNVDVAASGADLNLPVGTDAVIPHYKVTAPASAIATAQGDTVYFDDHVEDLNDATQAPTAAANADAVWDETLAAHLGAGSTGEALDTAQSGGAGLVPQQVRDAMKLAPTGGAPAAGSVDTHLDDILTDTGTTLPASIAALPTAAEIDTELTGTHGAGAWTTATLAAAAIATAVWDEALPGAFSSGSAGFILGTNLDLTISSVAAAIVVVRDHTVGDREIDPISGGWQEVVYEELTPANEVARYDLFDQDGNAITAGNNPLTSNTVIIAKRVKA